MRYLLLTLTISLVSCAPQIKPPVQPPSSPPAESKYAIAILQPNATDSLAQTVASKAVCNAKYNGVSVWTTNTLRLMTDRPSYQQLYNDLLPAKGLCKDVWVYVWTYKPGLFANDAAWLPTIDAFGRLAKAVKDLGFKGILFDNEPYNGTIEDTWGENVPPADLPYAYKRGQQIAAAIGDVPFFVFNGPSNADQTARDNGLTFSYPPDWKASAQFFFGLVDGKAKVIDGNGDYRWQTEAEIKASYDLRKNGLSIIPEPLKADYANRVSVGFLFYNQNWPKSTQKTLEMFSNQLKYAKKYADKYYAAYIETPGQGFGNNPGNWVSPDAATLPWINALNSAE